MKIYDANGMCWIWNQELQVLHMICHGSHDGQGFDNVEQALKWLNDNGYMEE